MPVRALPRQSLWGLPKQRGLQSGLAVFANLARLRLLPGRRARARAQGDLEPADLEPADGGSAQHLETR